MAKWNLEIYCILKWMHILALLLVIFQGDAKLLLCLAVFTDYNCSAKWLFLYKFIGLYAYFSGAKYYLLSLSCTNLISHSLSLNFYSKILNWVTRFVHSQFLNIISQSYSLADWKSVRFPPQSSPENSGRRKDIL